MTTRKCSFLCMVLCVGKQLSLGEAMDEDKMILHSTDVSIRFPLCGSVHIKTVCLVTASWSLTLCSSVLLLRVTDRCGRCIYLFCFIFWLCASLMSQLVLNIILLQRLSVIDIFLILTYFPLSKKIICNVPFGWNGAKRCQKNLSIYMQKNKDKIMGNDS
jgi:hypothetical protein